MISQAAYRKICVQFRVAAIVAARLRSFERYTCIALFFLCFASAASAKILSTTAANSASDPQNYLFVATLDNVTGETHFEHHPDAPQQPQADQPQLVIERIDFIGNRRIRTDTLKARIFSREGDPYNEETLRRDFQALWNTQFFEDVRLRVEPSPDRPDARIIVYEVKERPVIRRIRYDGIHSVSESDILDRFKEKKVGLSVESQFDPTRIKKAEVVLKDLLGEHGRQFAKVTPQYERIASSNAVILVFKIVEGPKVKVGFIHFKGNHAFSDRKLIRAMRNDRPYRVPLYFWDIPVLSKTYDRQKLSEDIEVGIRGIYQDNGYFKAVIGEPILENVEVNHIGVGIPVPGLGPHKGKVVNVTIPIEEGERYRMGTVKIVSSDPDKALSLKVEALKSIFPLKPGDIFAANKARKALENYGKAYGEFGFIDFTAEPLFDVDDDKKIINLTLKFDEQNQYYVRRINFSGNTTTRDKVIRRELLLDEGQLFNKRAWEVSILRLNQLDYFDRIEADKAAEIKRNTKERTVDITLKLKEKGKQSIGLQGGVSGLSGSFIGLTYQTNNFIGLGETLSFSAQFGDIQRLFQFGFTEPYLFDRPISTGFTIFSSRFKYDQARQAAIAYGQTLSINPNLLQNYNQDSTGFTAFASYPMRRFSFTRVGLSYGLSRTNITAFNDASKALFTQLQYRTVAGPSALAGIISSTITPTITYNSIDNPINATNGKSYFYSASFTGGPLGGNVNSVTNTFEYKMFHPINKKRNALGFRVQTAFTTGFGGKQIPPYSRFYLGGENDIRGFDLRAITPIAYIPILSTVRVAVPGGSLPIRTLTSTIAFPGADTTLFGNMEYRIPIMGPVSMALFADAGSAGIFRRSGLLLNQAAIDQIKLSFQQVPISKQLQLAPGTNFKLRMSTGAELIVNLPIIQAPFRIYYAYNPFRLRRQVVAPDPQFSNEDVINECNAAHLDALSCRLLVIKQLTDYQLSPNRINYFEPRSTFRFTVSRTF
jgi:outer membrane protein insertion porin family